MEQNRRQRKSSHGKRRRARNRYGVKVAALFASAAVVGLAGVFAIAKIAQKSPAREEVQGGAHKLPEELTEVEKQETQGMEELQPETRSVLRQSTETGDASEPQSETGSGLQQSSEPGSQPQQPAETGTAALLQPEAGTVLDTSAMTDMEIARYFFSQELTDSVFARINGISYKENENIGREELCYLRVLHVDLDGQTRVGELIVNQRIAQDVLEILEELYANAYPIEKMVLIDAYGADDNASMADNNSSAFNYRVIAGTDKLSNHSLGLAIDINPKYNPYVRAGADGAVIIEPEGSEAYADREADFPYKIEEGDLCHRLFLEHGFTWGGSWKSSKDYQHFEKK